MCFGLLQGGGEACHRMSACWRGATVWCKAAATQSWPSSIAQSCYVPGSFSCLAWSSKLWDCRATATSPTCLSLHQSMSFCPACTLVSGQAWRWNRGSGIFCSFTVATISRPLFRPNVTPATEKCCLKPYTTASPPPCCHCTKPLLSLPTLCFISSAEPSWLWLFYTCC